MRKARTLSFKPELLTTGQLCELTEYDRKSIARECKSGRLKAINRAGVQGRLYDVTEVTAWLKYKGLTHLISKLP